MERKIGEVFEFEGKKYEVVETDMWTCKGCAFNYIWNHPACKNRCAANERTDGADVIFVEVKE